jgi:hypothetical protein
MKYKNIKSAIHNFGHSFASYENYIDSDFVLYELNAIHRKGHEIRIDWKTGDFQPYQFLSPRIRKSVSFWMVSLEEHFQRQNVDPNLLQTFEFVWPVKQGHYVVALDDRGVEHRKDIMPAT